MKAADLRRAEPDVELLMQLEGTAIRPGPRPIVASKLLAAIRHAMLAAHRMQLTYGVEPDETRTHLVEPLGLLHGQRPYLVGRIKGSRPETAPAQTPTVFRLDRIHAYAVLPEPFLRDLAFNLSAFARQSFGVWQEEPFAVCVRFAVAAASEAAAFHFHPTQAVEFMSDGRLLVRFTAGGALEMCQHLATWEGSVDVLEPAWLRDQLAAWARKTADHHARVPSDFIS